MKKKVIVTVLALGLVPLAIWAQAMIAIGQWVVVNSSTTVPTALTNTVIRASKLTLIGRKANRTMNTSSVWIGMQSANDTQLIQVTSNAVVSILIPEGKLLDLSKVYLDVETAGDGVAVIYE